MSFLAQFAGTLRAKAGVAYVAYIRDGVLSDRVVFGWLFFWARFVLNRHKPLIIGITGSVGKSTTAEIVTCVLTAPGAVAVIGPVRKTTNNMNNWDGLPLTILGYTRWFKSMRERFHLMWWMPLRAIREAFASNYPRVLVLEYGTDRRGYLQPLVKLAPPDIAVITTVGPAHLQGLGSIEGVAYEKGTLARGVKPNGLVILGDEHDFVDELERQARSAAPAALVVRVSGRGARLARETARVIGGHLGLGSEVIDAGLSKCTAPERRLEVFGFGDFTLIDDSYNANPLSMTFGLDTLAETARPGQRRVAVLGWMAELGDYAIEYHRQMGEYARGRCDLLIGAGELARHYGPDHWFETSDRCAETIEVLVEPTDCVLVKGSASANMQQVSCRLQQSAKLSAAVRRT
jgi:UDP-N-acetylmuramoyl-tripeptide--D-alanyl-D-alanine ligase